MAEVHIDQPNQKHAMLHHYTESFGPLLTILCKDTLVEEVLVQEYYKNISHQNHIQFIHICLVQKDYQEQNKDTMLNYLPLECMHKHHTLYQSIPDHKFRIFRMHKC